MQETGTLLLAVVDEDSGWDCGRPDDNVSGGGIPSSGIFSEPGCDVASRLLIVERKIAGGREWTSRLQTEVLKVQLEIRSYIQISFLVLLYSFHLEVSNMSTEPG